jgi:hypothetical protein
MFRMKNSKRIVLIVTIVLAAGALGAIAFFLSKGDRFTHKIPKASLHQSFTLDGYEIKADSFFIWDAPLFEKSDGKSKYLILTFMYRKTANNPDSSPLSPNIGAIISGVKYSAVFKNGIPAMLLTDGEKVDAGKNQKPFIRSYRVFEIPSPVAGGILRSIIIESGAQTVQIVDSAAEFLHSKGPAVNGKNEPLHMTELSERIADRLDRQLQFSNNADMNVYCIKVEPKVITDSLIILRGISQTGRAVNVEFRNGKFEETGFADEEDSSDSTGNSGSADSSYRISAYLVYKDGSVADFDLIDNKVILLMNTPIGEGSSGKPSEKTKIVVTRKGPIDKKVKLVVKWDTLVYCDKPISSIPGDASKKEIIIDNTGCAPLTVEIAKGDSVLLGKEIPFQCGE